MAKNWNDVVSDGASSLFGVWAVSIAMGSLAQLLAFFLGRRGAQQHAVLFWAAFLCLFFGYSLIRGVTAQLLGNMRFTIPPSIGWLVAAGVVFALLIRLRKREELHRVALAFCFATAALAFARLGATVLRPQSQESDSTLVNPVAPHLGRVRSFAPDVYYVLLDAYPGARELREITGFDNSKFIKQMGERGFVDAAAPMSNYIRTAQALGGIFALDFPQTESPKTWQDSRRLFPRIIDAPQTPALIDRFQGAGYSVWQTVSPWSGCSGRHLKCVGAAGSREIDSMLQSFLSPTPLGRLAFYLFAQRMDGLDAITAHLALVSKTRPFFIFVHNFAPHPPQFLRADCRPHPVDADTMSDWDNDRRPIFAASVQCVNLKVIRLVDEILRTDPGALIVIQSDHGSAFTVDWETPVQNWSADAIRERTSFINLIRAPADCMHLLDRPIAQVNTGRFALACATASQPEFLPERTYLSAYPQSRGNPAIRRIER